MYCFDFFVFTYFLLCFVFFFMLCFSFCFFSSGIRLKWNENDRSVGACARGEGRGVYSIGEMHSMSCMAVVV